MDHGSHRTTGHLLKKGGSRTKFGRRNWKKRWFVLDLERGCLSYFKDASCARFKGSVRLGEQSSLEIPDSVSLRGRHRPTGDELLHYFELRGVLDDGGAPRSKPFKLRALGGDELFEWLQSLKASLALVRGLPSAPARPPRTPRTPAAPPPRPQAEPATSSEEEEGYSSPDDDDYPEVRASMMRVSLTPPHPAPRPDVDEAARLRHSLTSQEAAHAARGLRALWDRVDSREDGTAPSPRGSSIHDGAAPAAWAPARGPPPPPMPRVASLPDDEAPADEEPAAAPQKPARPPGWRPPPPKRGEARKQEVFDGLVELSASTDMAALEAAVDAALACGISFEAEEMVAARTRLQFLSATDDARSLLIKALDKDPDTKELGEAISFAVSAGLDPDEPAMQRAQAMLCEQLQAGDPAISTWC